MDTASLTVWTYLMYLALSVGMTVWVAQTLHKNGRVFLVDAMHGNAELADSINHLLVVGFYLVNVGFVCLFLKENTHPTSVPAAIEMLSTKIGTVLVILGFMHFGNLAVLNDLRKRGVAEKAKQLAAATA